MAKDIYGKEIKSFGYGLQDSLNSWANEIKETYFDKSLSIMPIGTPKPYVKRDYGQEAIDYIAKNGLSQDEAEKKLKEVAEKIGKGADKTDYQKLKDYYNLTYEVQDVFPLQTQVKELNTYLDNNYGSLSSDDRKTLSDKLTKMRSDLSTATSETERRNLLFKDIENPGDNFLTKISNLYNTDVTDFNNDNSREVLYQYIKSLEDPFKQNSEAAMASLASRGLTNSGIRDEQIGRLQSAYDQAKNTKASEIGTDKYNNLIAQNEQKYKQNLDTVLSEMETAFKKSGQDASQYYSENQALIDAQLQKLATDKQSSYNSIARNYSDQNETFWNNMDATKNLMGSIGAGVGGIVSARNNNSGSSYSSSYPTTYDFSSSAGRTSAINDLDKYKSLDPWSNYNSGKNIR
jgi:hypothetical protein